MKILNQLPPNYEEIKKVFNLSGKNPVFTYGNIVYYPFGKKPTIPDHLLVHEETHQKQQANYLTPDEWWKKYLSDSKFRLDQELEAYKNQFKFFKLKNKSWMPFLKYIVADLSGPMYGNIISSQEAFSKLI